MLSFSFWDFFATGLPSSILVIVAISLIYKHLRYNTTKPLGWKEPRKILHKDSHKEVFLNKNNDRRKFTNKVANETYDAIVIGSGPAGLTTAALLSLLNWKVLVLEKNEAAGGGMHTFTDNRREFETGLHYVGHTADIKQLLDLVSIKPVKWQQQGTPKNGFTYDKITIGDKTIPLRAGFKRWFATFIHHFPDYNYELRKYLEAIQQVDHWQVQMFFKLKAIRLAPPWLIEKLQRWVCPVFFNMARVTVEEKLIELGIGAHTQLFAFLCGQYGDYGLMPSEASFFIHAAIVMHYMHGGSYPVGGPREITKNIIPTILNAGGDVRVQAAVTRVILRDGAVQGVTVNGTMNIYCPCVVSAIGLACLVKPPLSIPLPVTSTDTIVKKQHSKSPFPPMAVSRFPIPSGSFMFLFVTLNPECVDLLPTHNAWVYPSHDFESTERTLRENPDHKGLHATLTSFFIASGSAKQRSYLADDTTTGATTMIVMTSAFPEWYAEWAELPHNVLHVHTKYNAWKNAFGDRLLEEGLLTHYPELRPYVLSTSVASPLTMKHYGGSSEGEVYGMSTHPSRWCDHILLPFTRFKGLYITGQDILTPGIAGAVSSAELTANVIVGYGDSPSNLLTGHDLVVDIRAEQYANMR